MTDLPTIDQLISKHSPYIYFSVNESCFPIPIELYLGQCLLESTLDPSLAETPTNQLIYQFYQKNTQGLFMSFVDNGWKTHLHGDPQNTTCYVKAIQKDDQTVHLVYFYLFSHTDPYRLFGCCCPLTKWAHRADLKFIIVELVNQVMNRVYYGAHGTNSGEWRNVSDIITHDSHPVAYACQGDHSFYPEAGHHPRIFCTVCDVTREDILSQPTPIRVYDETDEKFDPVSMGWVYFPGNMNTEGIGSPTRQWWWNGDVPEQSNSWWKRLLCCAYF